MRSAYPAYNVNIQP